MANYLLRERNGYATEGFLNNTAVLNVVETYLTGPFNGDVLNKLLDAHYGYRSYTQRGQISQNFTNLYPYLRFALIGPAGQAGTALITEGKSVGSTALVSVEQKEGGAHSVDLLSAVLKGNWFGEKIKPAVLVNALIGGECYDVEFSGGLFGARSHEQTNVLPPLIFQFALRPECVDILLKNILFVGLSKEKYGPDRLVDKGKYQSENSEALLQLIRYTWKNAASDEQRMAATVFIKATIAEVIKGSDSKTLREIYKIQSGADSRLLLGAAATTPLAIENSPVVAQGMFARSAPTEPVDKSTLITKLSIQLSAAIEKFEKDKGVKDVELHYHKINVLEGAKKYLEGALGSADFDKIKLDNPRYADGRLSHKTKDIVLEVENFMKPQGHPSVQSGASN